MTQFPTPRGCCPRSHGSQGKEVLAHLCGVCNNRPTSKTWLTWPPCQPRACFLPPTTLYWLGCCLAWGASTSMSGFVVSGTLTFLNDEASGGGLLCRLEPEGDHCFTWPLVQVIWFNIRKPGSDRLFFKQRRGKWTNFVSVHLLKVNTSRLW